MHVKKVILATLTILFAVTFYSCENIVTPASDGTVGYNNQYIVVYKDTKADVPQSITDPSVKAIAVLAANGISADALICTYDYVFQGFAATLTTDEVSKLKNDSRIEYIEANQLFQLPDENVIPDGKIGKDNVQAQTTPWGITDIGGPATYTGTRKAWILDTGVDLDHPDLNVNTSLSKTFVLFGNDRKSADDGNGHGTHCAGIIAAKNNTVGVVGVAPGATVVAVKVLNSQGSGSTLDIARGLDYIKKKATAGDVINISLGGSASTILDNAVISCANAGLYVSIAAGNSAANAANYSPARVNGTNLFTISAYGTGGVFASWSNYGNPPVDFSAPGVSIYSCYKSGQYATMSGTSMATPHVAGILLVNGGTVNSNGTVTGDLDSNPDTKAKL